MMLVGLDTNVLLRILIKDDASQLQKITDFFDKETSCTKLIVNSVIICEAIWVLESGYKYSKSQISSIIATVLHMEQFYILDRYSVEQSLSLYLESDLDFSDAIIAFINLERNADFNITFDKKAAKTSVYRLIK